jgi:Amt family ammonium transporter
LGVRVFERMRIDDVVGAIPAHLCCGIWGALAVPITNADASFATQLIGVLSVGGFVSLTSATVWFALKRTAGLRPSRKEEWMGLDHVELGLEVYSDWGADPFRKGSKK